MHRVDSRTYVGQPNELVTLSTQASAGGQVAVFVKGRDIGAARQFPLPPNPGDLIGFEVRLRGPLGANCVVRISTVDGASDGDFLMCQAHNPAPDHLYTCSVVDATALEALAEARGLQPSPRFRAAQPKKQPKKRKKTGKPSRSTRKGGRK